MARAEVVSAVASRPSLWLTAVRQAVRLAPRGWWHRWPLLPVPSPSYLAFRSITQYGDAAHPLVGEDVVAYLRWCRALERPA